MTTQPAKAEVMEHKNLRVGPATLAGGGFLYRDIAVIKLLLLMNRRIVSKTKVPPLNFNESASLPHRALHAAGSAP